MDSLTEAAKEEFATNAQSYIVSPIEFLLENMTLNDDIVRGMASFDPTVLVLLPVDQATFCFTSLYHIFQLRGWLPKSPEAEVWADYLGFLDQFRCT